VSYENHHPFERNKISKSKSYKSPLLASTSGTPVFYETNGDLIHSGLCNKTLIDLSSGESFHDTITDTNKLKGPEKNLRFDQSHPHIIKFNDGDIDTVRIISHSGEGLYYRPVSEPKKTRFVTMAQVDTILTDTSCSFAQEMPGEKISKPEMKGLIYSLIGFIPVAGIPFAIIGIVMGARNLHRIRKNMGSIRGKKISLSALIIGIVALVFNIIITILIFSAIATAFISGCKSVYIHF